MEEEVEKFKKLISECEEGIIFMLLGAVISADNVLTKEDAQENLKFLDLFEKSMKASSRSQEDKDKFLEFIKQGREILKQDIKCFEKDSLVKKLEEELPEFIWKADSYNYDTHGYYFVNHFCISDNKISIECCPPLFYKTYYEIAKPEEDYESWVKNHKTFVINSEEDLRLFIAATQVWIIKCGVLKESNRYEKQLILIHPDLSEYHVPKFLKDFDYIYTDPNNSDLRIGVMDARKWDFSKEELVNAISDNTASCFSIQPSDLKFVEDSCIWPENFMQDFYNKYPEARDIKEKYETDWD